MNANTANASAEEDGPGLPAGGSDAMLASHTPAFRRWLEQKRTERRTRPAAAPGPEAVAAELGAIGRRLAAIDERLGRLGVAPPKPPAGEATGREAASMLGVSADTLARLRKAGALRYRDASPPGSGRPCYRYPIDDLERFMRSGYRLDVRPAAGPGKKPVRRGGEAPRYDHLDLG